jgi:hypothetical protein
MKLIFANSTLTTAILLIVASSSSPLANAANLRQLNGQHPNVKDGIASKKISAHEKRQQLKEYFQERRRQLQVVATTVTDSGQIIDWIHPEVQLPEGVVTVATPPPSHVTQHHETIVTANPTASPANVTQNDIVSPEAFFELHTQPHAWGPEGTVPVLRGDTIVSLLRDDDLPESIDDFLSKYGNKHDIPTRHHSNKKHGDGTSTTGHRRHLQSAAVHKYVTTEQAVSNFGGEGYINTWDPFVWENGEFSLAQVAVAAEASTIQTVECGWQVFSGLYGDSYPHLFTFYTTNGYTTEANNLGGYNLAVSGFVQVSTTIFPGARITGSIPLSSYGGSQYSMPIKVQLFNNNWWVNVFGQWIGYYPAQLYAIESGGLATGSTFINWYGEIVDVTDGKATETWMGSGNFASEGFGYAAYMRNIKTYRTDCNCAANYSPQYYGVTNSKCYSYAPSFNSGTTWGSYFFFGGPGAYNNNQCNTE